MLHHLIYRGIRAQVLQSFDTGTFFGEVHHDGWAFSFVGDSLASTEAAFHDAVDEFMLINEFNDVATRVANGEYDSEEESGSDVFELGKRYDCEATDVPRKVHGQSASRARKDGH